MKLLSAFVLLIPCGCVAPLLGQMAPQSPDDPAPPATAQPAASEPIPTRLYGRIEGDLFHADGYYTSPTGLYKVKIPVLPQLGGTVSDTLNFVTFDDDYKIHINIGAFPLSRELKTDFETKGTKDFLIYFFTNLVMPDYARSFPGAKMEQNAVFLGKYQDGSILIFTLLPGGSSFDRRVRLAGFTGPAVAKRGNLSFLKNGHVFIISTELAERVLEGSTFKKSAEEEDAILRQRLMDIVAKMEFFPPAPDTKP
jgi:hypothetical protein